MKQSKLPDIGNKLFGIYLGTVLQHLSHGQLKVYIQGIYPEEWINDPDRLPVCRQIVSQFAGSHNGNGVFSYPNINSTVVCMFANGDQNLPLAIGTMLGGQNAFGQYEWIKNPDEIVSDKHLITAGKSHIQMHESGKISSIVCFPIRTEAKVEYDDSPTAELSTDHVVERPLCDKVDNDKVMNINCQNVLDNYANYGTISSSTHYFNPIAINEILNSETETSTIRKSGKISTDSYNIINNVGNRTIGQLSSIQLTNNTTILNGNDTSNEYEYIKQYVENEIDHNIDGYYQVSLVSDLTASQNFSSTTNGQAKSTSNSNKANAEARSYIDLQSAFGTEVNVKKSSIETYSNQSTNDNIVKNTKLTCNQSIESIDGATTFQSLSSLNYAENDSKLKKMHNVIHKSKAFGIIDCDKGIKFKSTFDNTDMLTIGGSTTIVKNDNSTLIDASNNKSPGIKLESIMNRIRSAGGATSERIIECKINQSPTDGLIDIGILNKVTSDECNLTMDEDGNVTIKATKSLTIEAPTIIVKCDSISTTAKDMICSSTNETHSATTMSLNASTMNISGGGGDCKINNVSLLNHIHMETQAGDVVAPQPTKTATASN